jgi:hypothetical protein
MNRRCGVFLLVAALSLYRPALAQWGPNGIPVPGDLGANNLPVTDDAGGGYGSVGLMLGASQRPGEMFTRST